MNPASSNNAPSPKIVLPFYKTASIFWVLFLLVAIFEYKNFNQFYYTPSKLALTHLFVLGFATMIIFGALFQLIPVILLTKIWSELFARITYYSLLIGTIGLCSSFYFSLSSAFLLFSGEFLLFALLSFAFNIIMTFLMNPGKELEKLFILSSVIWLSLTALLGLTLAADRYGLFLGEWHFLLFKTHIHIGFFGWFLQLIIGVSSVLFPMFFLNHQLKRSLLRLCFILLNSSLIGWIISYFSSVETGVYVAYAIGGFSVFFYLIFIIDLYRNRIKKKLDFALKQSMISYLFLAVILLFLIVSLFLNSYKEALNLAISLVVLFFFGFITNLILGKTFKTLPFIVWLHIYKPFVGKEKTPLPKDLYNDTFVRFQGYLHSSGILILLIGLFTHFDFLNLIGLFLLLAAATLYTINVFKIIHHKRSVS